MESKEDLMRIAMEGFALVDKYFNKKGRRRGAKQAPRHAAKWCQLQPQQNPLHQVKPVSADCYEVVQFGEAMPANYKDYQKRASAAMRH